MNDTNDKNKKKLTLNKVVKSTISGREGSSVAVERKKKKVIISDEKAQKLKEILAQAEEEEKKKEEEAQKERELHQKREELILKDQQEREEIKKKLESQQEKSEKQGKKEKDNTEKTKKPSKKSEKKQQKLSIKNVSFANIDNVENDEEQLKNMEAFQRAREKEKQKNAEKLKSQTEKIVHEITLPEAISVKELAIRMAEKSSDVVKKLMEMGMMVTINEMIDADTAELIATELGHKVKRVSDTSLEEELKDEKENSKDLKPRAPVVTIMGHVDHGKTSLLDALRETDVVAKEAGGITQHIGAYKVKLKNGKEISFIDTPGHAAFSSMRARGANVTDIVVLVVAANDSIMPQTIEAINHAKAAGVPMIVAINKIDLPDANPNKVKTDLLAHEVVVEDMGGDVLSVEVSAKQKKNLDKLEEAILLQAEILNLKANPNKEARGTIVESKMEKGLGPVATVLVQKGTLKVGDIFVSGSTYGKVRAIENDKSKRQNDALPSDPVRVLGFSETPAAGDDFVVLESEGKARQIADIRKKRAQDKLLAKSKSTMEEIFENIQAGDKVTLPIIIKADVQGSIEAIKTVLDKIKSDKAKINVLHTAVGGINESDITLAKASGAVVIGFNVRASTIAQEMAKQEKIDIRYYSVIYNLENDIKSVLSGMIAPEIKENVIGFGEIIEIFKISGNKIAGIKVTNGIIKRNSKARIIRDDVVIHTGTIGQLKRFKEDVKEAREGFECGVTFEKYSDIQKGDKIECFELEEVKVEI